MDKNPPTIPAGLLKSPAGITGLDEITGGGLSSGRPTLVCGSAGCGKTMLAMRTGRISAYRKHRPSTVLRRPAKSASAA